MILWQFIAWYNLWSRGGIGVIYVSISYYWSFHVFGPINLRSQIHGWGFTMGTLSIHNEQKDELEYIEKSKRVFKMATTVAKFCRTELFRSVAINLKFLLRKASMQKLNWSTKFKFMNQFVRCKKGMNFKGQYIKLATKIIIWSI